MFTGIIERAGTITHSRSVAGGRRLRVDAAEVASSCPVGSSVCVSGVCLTVASAKGCSLDFDVITETLTRTTLGGKRTGDRVNLERALQVGGRFDGHFVQGHVDGTGRVEQIHASPAEHVIRIRPEALLVPYIIAKGSVAIDGVSMTVAGVHGDCFSVALIPTTLKRTTLSELACGAVVNLETDIIVRTIVGHLSRLSTGGGLTLERLGEAGFA